MTNTKSDKQSRSEWVAYVVRCADESLYTGITTDIDRRLLEHNSDNKKGARYTRARRPVSLVYQQGCDDRQSASQFEYRFKQLTRQQKLRFIKSKYE